VIVAGSTVAQEPCLNLADPQSRASYSRSRCPAGPTRVRRMSRWWVVLVLPWLGVAAVSWWVGDLLLPHPDVEAEGVAIATISMFMMSVGTLGAGLIAGEALLLARWHESSFVFLPVGSPCPPGWFADPWGQAPSRWWNGFNWTGRVA
jgi:hypothetical protein